MAAISLLLYAQWNASAQTLSNRWSFNAPAGGFTVTDSVGGVVATLQGSAALDGSEVVLDGSSGSYVALSSNLLAGLQAVSIESWANSSSSPDNVCLFEFSDGVGTGAAYVRYVIHDSGNTDNQFELANFASTTGNPNQQLKSAVGWGDVPVHVVCVYDPTAGIQAIYTNGLLEAFRIFPTNQTTLSSVSSNAAALGRSPWWSFGDPYMSGTISEFRIWNGRLNGLQIAALDSAGPGAVSTNYGSVTNIQLQVKFNMTQNGVQQAAVLASASALTVHPDIASLCTFASANTGILTVNGSGSITAVAPGSTTITAFFGSVSNSQTITVAQPIAALSNRWSFNAPAGGSTVTDSVQGVVATLNGDAVLDGTNVVLDGTAGTYVELGQNLVAGMQAVTCEGWLATNAASPDNVHLFEFSDGSGTGLSYYRFNLHNSANGNNFAEVARVSSGGDQKLTGTPGLGGLGGLHVVVIYDPSAQVQAIFTNGALETVRSGVTTALSGVSPNEASLGQSPWSAFGDPYLSGSISEFRIYSGELTPQQVAINHLIGPTALDTNGPGALQSIALNVGPTLALGVSKKASLLATYARLTNFDLTANSIFPVAGLTLTSSATNVISIDANNVLTGRTNGTSTITATYQGFTSQQTVTVAPAPFKFKWSAPVPFNGLNADQILTNVSGLVVGAAVFGTTPQTVTLGNGQIIIFTADGSVATATGNGTATGAYLGGTNTTGNADFDATLDEFRWDGGPKTISVNNLTPGHYYSVQLFGLDNRSGSTARQANYQDPNYVLDISATFAMGDDAYVVGSFWASNATETIRMNLPTGNAGNINALVLREVPNLSIQKLGPSLQLTWRTGTLLEATSLLGPWTTNSSTSPYTTIPATPQKFYRVQLP